METNAFATSYWALIKQTFSSWSQDKAERLAAALALYTMLSIAPLLVITMKVVTLVFGEEATTGQVQRQLAGLMGPSVSKAVNDIIVASKDQPHSGTLATVLSVIMLLFGATGVFGALQDSMNTIWEVKPKPGMGVLGWIRNRFLSMAMVFGIVFLLLVSLFISSALTVLSNHVGGAKIGLVFDLIVSLGVVTVLFAMIFKYLPDVKVPWKYVWLGAGLTAALFMVGKYALAFYFKKGSTASAFGAAGSLAVMLLWVYYSAQILFLGAEFTRVYAKSRGHQFQPSANAVPVTEEARAQQGMPHRGTVQAAAGGRRTPAMAQVAGPRRYSSPPRSSPVTPAPPRSSRRIDYAYAAGGLVLGAIAGGIGAYQWARDPNRPARKRVAAVRLNERLSEVERRFGRVARIKRYLEDMDVKQRVDRLESHIRSASAGVRSEVTGRPKWLIKVADFIAGAR